MAKHSTTLIKWRLEDGSYVGCDVACRRRSKASEQNCPCTGLCKGMSAKQAAQLLRENEMWRVLVAYARTRPGVTGMSLAPEVTQLDIDFSRDDD